MSAASDRELVAQAARGERAAARLLFMRHYAKIYRFAARQTGSEARAGDILNDVFLETWRQAPRFRGEVSTWLLGMARSGAAAARRRREEATQEERAPMAEAADHVVEEGKGHMLTHLIDALPEEQRSIMDLAHYHGKSIAEIGEILGMPEATIGTRMLEARKALGRGLKASGFPRKRS